MRTKIKKSYISYLFGKSNEMNIQTTNWNLF